MAGFLKISGLLSAAGLFVWFVCYKYLDYIEVQAGFLVFAGLLKIFRTSLRRFWNELKLFAAFVMLMGLFYIIFGLLELNGQPLHYWLIFGVNRILLFVSSMLISGFLLSFITMEDIIRLPVRIEWLKYLILGNALFQSAQRAMDRLGFFVEMFPEYQTQAGSRLRRNFHKNLTTVLALVFFIIRESEVQGELIDNRIRHCFKKIKE